MSDMEMTNKALLSGEKKEKNYSHNATYRGHFHAAGILPHLYVKVTCVHFVNMCSYKIHQAIHLKFVQNIVYYYTLFIILQ